MEGNLLIQSAPRGSLRDFYQVIFRQKRKIILFFCTVMLVTTLGTFLATEIYQSEAMVMVRMGRESVTLDPTATTGQVIQMGQSRDNEIKTELEILQSRDLAEKVVDAIGPETILGKHDPPTIGIQSFFIWIAGKTKAVSKDEIALEMDNAVDNLMKNLEVENQKNSNIILVSYKNKNPELAQLVGAKFIDCFLNKHIQVHRTVGSNEFFSQQTEQLRTSLMKNENALKELKNKSGIGSINEQRTILLTRIGALKRGLEENGASLVASKSKVETIEKTLTALPKILVHTKVAGYSGNPIDFLQQRLLELQLKEKDLQTTMTEKSRLVQDIQQQIAEAQELMRKEGATHDQVTRLALLTEHANLAEFQSRAGVLRQDLANAQNELKELNEAEVKIAQLEREIEVQKTNYRNYSEKLSQARIDRALETEKISNISVVQPASHPVKPIWPRKAMNLALGFFLGALGGLGLAFISEYIDHTFKTPEEVTRKLKLPFLVAVPNLNSQRAKESLGTGATFHLPESERSWGVFWEMTECCDFLPANIICSRSSQEVSRLLAITSCYPGEGVSTFAASLALNLVQQQGGRVLLVDANLDQPSTHLFFGASNKFGLAEIPIHGPDLTDGIQPSTINNLDILALGRGDANLVRFFESRQFAEMLGIWKRDYSSVIFDTPALLEAPWVARFNNLMDGVILVVEAEKTRWEVAQKARELLDQTQVKVVGVVLNKRRFYIPEWLYRTL